MNQFYGFGHIIESTVVVHLARLLLLTGDGAKGNGADECIIYKGLECLSD